MMEERLEQQEQMDVAAAQEETSGEPAQEKASDVTAQEETSSELAQEEAGDVASQEEINEVDGEPIYHADEGEE